MLSTHRAGVWRIVVKVRGVKKEEEEDAEDIYTCLFRSDVEHPLTTFSTILGPIRGFYTYK
jgi:hypothetical protein